MAKQQSIFNQKINEEAKANKKPKTSSKKVNKTNSKSSNKTKDDNLSPKTNQMVEGEEHTINIYDQSSYSFLNLDDQTETFNLKNNTFKFNNYELPQTTKKNIEFLTGIKDLDYWQGNDKDVIAPIFRLGIVLSNHPNGVAHILTPKNHTLKSETTNFDEKLYEELLTDHKQTGNVFNVYFIDYSFQLTIDQERELFQLKVKVNPPSGVNLEEMNYLYSSVINKINLNDDNFSMNTNTFWDELFKAYDLDNTNHRPVYTIWLKNDRFGINVLKKLFENNPYYSSYWELFMEQITNYTTDLVSIASNVSNEVMDLDNDFSVFFKKWINFKNADVALTGNDIYNKKNMNLDKELPYFKIDHFMAYFQKSFFNILDQMLYYNSTKKLTFQLVDAFSANEIPSTTDYVVPLMAKTKGEF